MRTSVKLSLLIAIKFEFMAQIRIVKQSFICTLTDRQYTMWFQLDHRKPNVLRLAPVHLYNSFHDVYRFVMMLGDAMREAKTNAQYNGDLTDK